MIIKNVVFDLGGVLIDWNPKYLYRKIFSSEQQVDWFLDNVCTGEWNSKQDEGRTMAEATKSLVDRYPEYTMEITSYYQRWTEMLNGQIEGTVRILETLRSNSDHRLLALTNWSGESFPTALKMFDFLNWFEGIVVSGDEKLIKPDHRIYQVLFERYRINPENSVFIDDSEKNVEASRELGMTGIHFVNPESLKLQLTEVGVI
ncbi:MAG: hydrolase [Cyclobacteriaceae bacterium]|nr:MAG: hydrolase [Cyclobacteriaceae bacterium]